MAVERIPQVDDAIARILMKWLVDREYVFVVGNRRGGTTFIECYIEKGVWPGGEERAE